MDLSQFKNLSPEEQTELGNIIVNACSNSVNELIAMYKNINSFIETHKIEGVENFSSTVVGLAMIDLFCLMLASGTLKKS